MVVSLQTALKLKDAGFPQPEPKPGQFWYAEAYYKGGELEHHPLCVVVEWPMTRALMLRRVTCESLSGENGGNPLVFAPTISDLIQGYAQNMLPLFQGMEHLFEGLDPSEHFAQKHLLSAKK